MSHLKNRVKLPKQIDTSSPVAARQPNSDRGYTSNLLNSGAKWLANLEERLEERYQEEPSDTRRMIVDNSSFLDQ